ncbi:hypothetical protein, partial [Candidatus Magnetobacterium casense]
MGVMTSSSFAKLLYPGLSNIFNTKYNEFKPEWPEIFTQHKSTRAFEEELGITGYGMPQVKPEGLSISYDEMSQGWSVRYNHAVFALGFIVTQEVYEDNLYPQVGLRNATSLAFSMRQGKETVAANVLNRAFDGSYLGEDGATLCSTSHVTRTGLTWSNRTATDADISEASLEQALIDIGGFVNERGLKIRVLARKLIIPRQEEFNTARILKNIEARPGTADRDINAIATLGAFPEGYRVNHFLTDTNAWFVLTDCPDGFKCYQRRPMKFDIDDDFPTSNA